MKWWKHRSKTQPRLTDEEFNTALNQHVRCIWALLSERTTDFVPMAIEIRESGKEINALVNENEGEVTDLKNLVSAFGRARMGQVLPQAIMFAFLAESEDGSECIVSHGATPDGRENAAILDLKRDRDGCLEAGKCDLRYHPGNKGGLPKLNYAMRILKAWEE
jgi:hypothetical protein